ncbi:hypothetical protein [Herbidospora galbida]|nr:hypothetical protein [Herbidospora galbida]
MQETIIAPEERQTFRECSTREKATSSGGTANRVRLIRRTTEARVTY